MVGNNGEPVRWNPSTGHPVYQAICDHPGCEVVCVEATYTRGGLFAPQEWVDEWVGKGPQFCDEHAPPPPDVEPDPAETNPVPATVTPAQIRIAALLAYRIQPEELDAIVMSVIENVLPSDDMKKAARVKWEYATVIERGHPLILAVSSQLQKSPEQVDDLFRLAASL